MNRKPWFFYLWGICLFILSWSILTFQGPVPGQGSLGRQGKPGLALSGWAVGSANGGCHTRCCLCWEGMPTYPAPKDTQRAHKATPTHTFHAYGHHSQPAGSGYTACGRYPALSCPRSVSRQEPASLLGDQGGHGGTADHNVEGCLSVLISAYLQIFYLLSFSIATKVGVVEITISAHIVVDIRK